MSSLWCICHVQRYILNNDPQGSSCVQWGCVRFRFICGRIVSVRRCLCVLCVFGCTCAMYTYILCVCMCVCVVSCADSQTGWLSLPLVSAVSSLLGAPQWLSVLPCMAPSSHSPKAVECGPSHPTPLTVFDFMSCRSGWVEFTFPKCACTYCACTQCVFSVCYENGTTTGLVSCCSESGQRA